MDEKLRNLSDIIWARADGNIGGTDVANEEQRFISLHYHLEKDDARTGYCASLCLRTRSARISR